MSGASASRAGRVRVLVVDDEPAPTEVLSVAVTIAATRPCAPCPTKWRNSCDLDAPPRLAAYLRAVHDVTHQLLDWMAREHPSIRLDRDAALFGAATHDIGKTAHPAELSGPGSSHEAAGRELLPAHGIAPEPARFAATHATWTVRTSTSKICW